MKEKDTLNNEEFQTMTEETAQELLRVFESINNTEDELLKRFIEYTLCETIKKALGYAEKYSSATFITRWYWRRKIWNLSKAYSELLKLYESTVNTLEL